VEASSAQPKGFISPNGLRRVAWWLGFLLWFPALGLNLGPISLQPVDILLILTYPLMIAFIPRISGLAWCVLILFCTSILISFVSMGGAPLILIYYLAFPLPFLVLTFLACSDEDAAIQLLRGFVVGGAASLVLYFAQLAFGSQLLDFRNNRNFSAPPQFERGFAIFPEVSTFATHIIYLVGLLLVYLRSGIRRVFSPMGFTLIWLVAALVSLLITRSSSVMLVAPVVFIGAFLLTQKLTVKGLAALCFIGLLGAGILYFFVNELYVDRQGDSAFRSMFLRGITMIAGVSVLTSGEVFGVGVGNNHEITFRALDIGQQLGFTFRQLPAGVNSFIFARVFEEGYGAVLQFGFSIGLFVLALMRKGLGIVDKTLLVLCLGSLLVGLLVTGYRGIYMNWFWLIVPAAILGRVAQTITLPQTVALRPLPPPAE
jgi:hypothetical protein